MGEKVGERLSRLIFLKRGNFFRSQVSKDEWSEKNHFVIVWEYVPNFTDFYSDIQTYTIAFERERIIWTSSKWFYRPLF